MLERMNQLLNTVKRLPIFGWRPMSEVDLLNVHRLHTVENQSLRSIARTLRVPFTNLQRHYTRWLRTQPAEPDPVPAVQDPPRVQIAEEPPATSARPEPTQEAVALPPGLEAALDGLLAPAPRQIAPAPIPEAPTVAAEEPSREFIFLVADQSTRELAFYRAPCTIWSDASAPELRDARRIYLVVPDDPARVGILGALRKSPLRDRVRVCIGQPEALFIVAARELSETRGDFRNYTGFEAFAGIVAATEPVIVKRPEPVVRGSGYVADPWPNRSLM